MGSQYAVEQMTTGWYRRIREVFEVITSHNKTLEPLVGPLTGRGPIYLGVRVILREIGFSRSIRFYPANYDSTISPFPYIHRVWKGKSFETTVPAEQS
jgi:hypothetical protein